VIAYIVWLGKLSPEKLRALAGRLRLPHHTAACLLASRKLWDDLETLNNATPGQVVNRLDTVPPEVLYALFIQDIPPESTERIRKYNEGWKHVKPITDGLRLQEMHIPPGPVYKKILAGLRTAWLDGRIHSQAEEDQYLQQMLKQLSE